jgi:hypothetical protein
MKIRKNALLAATIAATLALGACTDGVEDDGVVDDTGDGITATTLTPDTFPSETTVTSMGG